MFGAVVDAYRRTRKPKDIFWNKFVARPLAAVVIVPLAKTSVTPNQITLATLPVFLAGAALIAFRPGWGALCAGVGILELSYVLDCADGQLARLKGTSSPVGAHLDFLMDELKAFALVAAVAVRLWQPAHEARWLLEGLGALVAVAGAISLTTFMRRPEYAAATGAAVAKGKREAWVGAAARFEALPVYDRLALGIGAALAGPAIIEEASSTLIVPPDAHATVDPSGNLIVDLAARAG